MKRCEKCSSIINEKYDYCWDCLQIIKNEQKNHLETFICRNCKIQTYSMKWANSLCCNCYNHLQKEKRIACSINLINTDTAKKI